MGKLIHFDNFFQIFKNADWYTSKFLESNSEPTVLIVNPTVNTEVHTRNIHFALQKWIQAMGSLLIPTDYKPTYYCYECHSDVKQ